MQRVLILGGTTEARELAQRLAGRPALCVTVSLAGRTRVAADQGATLRSGGFGGAAGLADYLVAERIDALVDATHPYAAIMSTHATNAAAMTGVPLVSLRRPPWMPVEGDRWIEVDDAGGAVAMLGEEPLRVFVALGRNEIACVERSPQHFYLVRSVEPIEPRLAVPRAVYVTARGPFSEAGDRFLLESHRIEMVEAKNSGGSATVGKIAAARALGIPVIMLRRPALPAVPSVTSVEEAVRRLDHELSRRAHRGV
jgi:precorrin-6A/cobalt-precorrin-6A reductase